MTGATNPELKETIRALREASRRGGNSLWEAVADQLDRAHRRRAIVNLSSINRHTEAGDVIVVPGKVLASGSLFHPVTVAAFAFSDAAREKISLADGKTITLMELLEEGTEPSKIKIMK